MFNTRQSLAPVDLTHVPSLVRVTEYYNIVDTSFAKVEELILSYIPSFDFITVSISLSTNAFYAYLRRGVHDFLVINSPITYTYNGSSNYTAYLLIFKHKSCMILCEHVADISFEFYLATKL